MSTLGFVMSMLKVVAGCSSLFSFRLRVSLVLRVLKRSCYGNINRLSNECEQLPYLPHWRPRRALRRNGQRTFSLTECLLHKAADTALINGTVKSDVEGV
jgi:hypothetical protein